MPETKDIALAVLGGSVGLAAVLVVFIGFLLAHAETFPAEVADTAQRRYRIAAKWGLVPTSAAILEALACYGWLFWREPWLFCVWSIGFVIVATGFLAYAVIAILMI